jgi:hypothetical protein
MSTMLRLTGFVAAVMIALVLAAAAGAGDYTDLHWATSGPGWKGTRVTVDNPDSSQVSISSAGDWFITSAYADSGAGGSSLIQIGVTLEYHDPQQPTCDLGMNTPALYHFIETEQQGLYRCYGPTAATYSTSHLRSVVRGSDGVWHSYRDGVATSITNSWTGCSGDACRISAHAEEHKFTDGRWAAKYAGSGNTAWQFWNGSVWNTITMGYTRDPGLYWSLPSGPFPGGIWSFTYSH